MKIKDAILIESAKLTAESRNTCEASTTAREWATKLRTFQDELHTAAYGDPSREWTHLPLVQVTPPFDHLTPHEVGAVVIRSLEATPELHLICET